MELTTPDPVTSPMRVKFYPLLHQRPEYLAVHRLADSVFTQRLNNVVVFPGGGSDNRLFTGSAAPGDIITQSAMLSAAP